jgi:hypothetical protein
MNPIIASIIFAEPPPGPELTGLFSPRVVDNNGIAIALAGVEVFKGTSRVATQITSTEGRVEIPLLLNTAYLVRVYAQGYAVQSQIPLVLVGDTAPEFRLQEIPLLPPSDNPEQSLPILTFDAGVLGMPRSDVRVTIKRMETRPVFLRGRTEVERTFKLVTKENGRGYLPAFSSDELAQANYLDGYTATCSEKECSFTEVPFKIPPEGGRLEYLTGLATPEPPAE